MKSMKIIMLVMIGSASMSCFGDSFESLSNLGDPIAVDGEKGNVKFRCVTSYCSTPLAVGTKSNLVVAEPEHGRKTLFPTLVESSDEKVIEVTKIVDKTITLEAKKAGKIKLLVETDEGRKDQLEFRAEVADAVTFREDCEGVYLVGPTEAIEINFSLKSGEESLRGVGYFPFEIERGEIVRSKAKRGLLKIILPETENEAKDLLVSSTIDDSEIRLRTASIEDLDDLRLLETFEIGEGVTCVPIKAETQGRDVCNGQDANYRAQVQSPQICEFFENPPHAKFLGDLAATSNAALFCYTFLAEGECKVSFDLPEANGGEGIQKEISFEGEVRGD